MSGYQRFLPRDEMRTTAHALAEVAEAAEVQAIRGVRAAEAFLKPAELRPRTHQPQQTSAEVQQQQSSRIPELQQVQQLQQAPDPETAKTRDGTGGLQPQHSDPRPDGSARPGIPAEWCEGVGRLAAMAPSRSYPTHAWQQLIVDADHFLDCWGRQAVALGWADWELFGCCRHAPWGRIQGMGLVLLLRGDEIAALTATEVVIRTRTGARQTYRRKPCDPLHPAERCLIWELG